MMITIRALKTGRFNNDNSGIIKFLLWCEHNGRAASVQRFGFSLHTTRPLITNKIPPIEQTNFGPKKYFHTYELARVRTSNFDLSLNALPWFMMSRRRDNGKMSSRGKSPEGENKYRGGTSDATTSSSIIVSSIMMSCDDFLDAPSHLYMRLCPSVRRSVRMSRVIFEGEKNAH